VYTCMFGCIYMYVWICIRVCLDVYRCMYRCSIDESSFCAFYRRTYVYVCIDEEGGERRRACAGSKHTQKWPLSK